MKSFNSFVHEYLIIESIKYLDRTLFRNILNGKYEMSSADLKKWENKKLISEAAGERNYLDDAAEKKLIKIYQDDPTSKAGMDAMNKLVENKMPFIYSLVGRTIKSNYRLARYRDDMIQEASIALTKAVEKFDLNSGNIFNAYAIKCMTGVILNLANTSRRRSIDELKGDTKGNFKASIDSLDKRVSGATGDYADKDSELGEIIPDENPNSDIINNLDDQKKRIAMNDWIENLPEVERKALRMYFPQKGEPATFLEIGQEIGMTKMGAKKVVDRAIEKLREMAKENGYADETDDEKTDNAKTAQEA